MSEEAWERYVRNPADVAWLRVRREGRAAYLRFLEERYGGGIERSNRAYHGAYDSFEDVPFPQDLLAPSRRLKDWAEIIKVVPAEHILLKTPEFDFRDFLREKYHDDLDALNEAHEADYLFFDQAPIPAFEVEYADFLEHKREIRRDMMTASYRRPGLYPAPRPKPDEHSHLLEAVRRGGADRGGRADFDSVHPVPKRHHTRDCRAGGEMRGKGGTL